MLSRWDVRIRVLIPCAPVWLGRCVRQHPSGQRLTRRLRLAGVILDESDVDDHGGWIRQEKKSVGIGVGASHAAGLAFLAEEAYRRNRCRELMQLPGKSFSQQVLLSVA